jgi:sugar-specific transcriptional regulator TrmB
MNIELLRKVGLSGGEIRVYSAILDLGTCPLSRIHEKTGIERRNIYDILNKLIERGLITYITENKKRLFRTSHPSKIIDYIEEKKQDLDRTRQEITKELPSLVEKFNLRIPGITAEIYRGIEGIKVVFEDMLNYNDIYVIAGGFYIVKEIPYYWPNYNKRRIAAKSKWHNLVKYELKKQKIPTTELVSIKFLPKEFSGNPVAILIYGNKIVNLSWREEFAFMIESKDIAENYRKYHKYLWDNVAKSS